MALKQVTVTFSTTLIVNEEDLDQVEAEVEEGDILSCIEGLMLNKLSLAIKDFQLLGLMENIKDVELVVK